MNDIKVPPFTDGQKKLIEMTKKLASSRKICDVDDIDDDIERPKPLTHFILLTGSPEALARYLSEHHNCSKCPAVGKCVSVGGCYNALLAWLKMEYKE